MCDLFVPSNRSLYVLETKSTDVSTGNFTLEHKGSNHRLFSVVRNIDRMGEGVREKFMFVYARTYVCVCVNEFSSF